MAVKVEYTCDCCGKLISELYGPLTVEIRGTKEPASDVGNISLDLCSWNCLEIWVREKSEAGP